MANGNTEDRSGLNRRQFMGAGAAMAAGAALGARRVSANDRLGVGLIGTGGRGSYHLNVLRHLAEKEKSVDIVAVCDVYRPRLDRAAKEHGAKPYMDYRELLADPRVDVVGIATPDHVHGQQSIDALKAGKPVYCEKPVTHWSQFEKTKELADVAKETGLPFQLGTQGMSDSAWSQMKALVKDGLIGQPILAECGYFRVGDWGEQGMPIDDPNAKPGPDLDWEAFLGEAPKRDFDVSRFFRWRMYWDYAGGPCTDLYPHSLTPVIDILGVGMPAMAVASGGMFRYTEREVPDTFNMLVDYPGGLTIAVLGTQGNNYSGTGDRGSGGRVPVVRGWDGSLTIRDDKIAFIPADGSKKKARSFTIDEGENMLHHYRGLIDAAKNGTHDTRSPADLALHTQTALIMGMKSLREGRSVRYDKETRALVT